MQKKYVSVSAEVDMDGVIRPLHRQDRSCGKVFVSGGSALVC